MIKKSLVVGLLSAGFVAVPGMALASTQFNPAPVPVATTVSSSITASQADQAAIAAVGGGTVTSTSSDTYQGSAVFDIHVLYNSTVYDVKVLKATGGVALKKVSSEQPSSAPAPTPSSITASQADQAAIAAVGGGTVTSTSSDTYQGSAVFDIHVLYNSTVYDVKVLKATGGVALKKVSSEQPSSAPAPTPSSITASQADQAAIAAVGGGTVTSTSSDTYQGSAVFDIHVLYNSTVYDVKVLKATGGVALKKVSSEQSTSANSSDQKDAVDSSTPEHSSTPSQDKQTPATPPSSSNGITFGVKLTVAPSAFQSFVNQALAQNNGTLKWIKLISHQGGDVQANIKVNLSQGGTVKVIDLFSPSNQLISQTVGS